MGWDTQGGGSSSWTTDDTTSIGIAVHPTPISTSVDYVVNTDQQLIFGTGGDGYTIHEKSEDDKLYIVPSGEDVGLIMDTDGTVSLTGSVTGNAGTSTKWASPITIATAEGAFSPITFSFSLDGSQNVTVVSSLKDDIIAGEHIAMGSDALGDLMTYNGDTDEYERFGMGQSQQVLTSTPTGLDWVWFNQYTITQITLGAGLTDGGLVNGNQRIDMGTPATITASTTNTTSATSHSHVLDLAGVDVNGGKF